MELLRAFLDLGSYWVFRTTERNFPVQMELLKNAAFCPQYMTQRNRNYLFLASTALHQISRNVAP